MFKNRGGSWNFVASGMQAIWVRARREMDFSFVLLGSHFFKFSKFVVLAGSWSPKDGAEDGRFAR